MPGPIIGPPPIHNRHRVGSLRFPLVAALLIVLVHQPLVWGAARLGAAPWRAFDLTPVSPWAVPALVSAVCWGAIWGALLIPVRWRWPSGGWGVRLAAATVISLCTVVLYAVLSIRRNANVPDHPVWAATVGFGINAIWLTATDWLVARRYRQTSPDR